MSYPYSINYEVPFGDLDAFGHVNNIIYFRYFEIVRTKYLIHFLKIKDIQQLPVILAHTRCDFKEPALFGDQLKIEIGISRFGNRSFDTVYRVSKENGRLLASGLAVLVMFDHLTQKPIVIPTDLREKVAEFQKDWKAESS